MPSPRNGSQINTAQFGAVNRSSKVKIPESLANSQNLGEQPGRGISSVVAHREARARDWQHWMPYAAVAWSLIYAGLAIYWALGGSGFPYTSDIISSGMAPIVGRFGPVVTWIVVVFVGLPAALVGTVMLRGVRSRLFRLALIAAGILVAGFLLLLMTSLSLLTSVGYIPYAVVALLKGNSFGLVYLRIWTQWTMIHQLLCLAGGFIWLAATVSYARRSGDACLYCGRRDGPEGWTSPDQAARWGRIAVYIALVAPILYAVTRYAWVLGIPLGMSEAELRSGQEKGTWISGLFLANFGLVGAVLMLGLIQRWGEIFPRWMIGLNGRRVPIALAVIPASLVSVLMVVGGIGIWLSLTQMAAGLEAVGVEQNEIIWQIFIKVGPTLLFPVWGAALAVATLGYYYRRRGPCSVCGRGAPGPGSIG